MEQAVASHNKNITARSLLLTEPQRLEWVSAELPPPGAQEVLVQTRTGAISIGSELPRYQGRARGNRAAVYPCMTGYESVGTVLACGAAVKRMRPGDRIVAFYGHRTHAIVPEEKAIVVPDDIADALALLAILSCDAAKGVRKIVPQPEEAVLVTGAGTMGLLTLFILKAYGVTTVDVVEPRVERHTLAFKLGASDILCPQELPETSERYAVGFECSSRNTAFTLLQNQMRQGGRICITADGNIEPLVLAAAFHEKELQLVGTSDGWNYHEHAKWYFQELRQHSMRLEDLFEIKIAARELRATFAQLASGTIQPVKVLVDYD
ncbi:MAG TPA: zinc-binding alcohol dehydrogenase [Ktedonobacteraceae bacterium]|nr:zinc-binding alcohol dehydrogenase [Ktedonobacteraceae bacterium]